MISTDVPWLVEIFSCPSNPISRQIYHAENKESSICDFVANVMVDIDANGEA